MEYKRRVESLGSQTVLLIYRELFGFPNIMYKSRIFQNMPRHAKTFQDMPRCSTGFHEIP